MNALRQEIIPRTPEPVSVLMGSTRHILVNGLAIGSAGGFAVGREIMRHVALLRPEWIVTAALVEGNHIHERIRSVEMPENLNTLWAPSIAQSRARRARWERRDLVAWATANGVDAVIQLNGMLVRAFRQPTLCHMQDPWPYRPLAWETALDRCIAWLKRRAHRRTLRHANAVTWTSNYLRELICGYHSIEPRRSGLVYNGVSEEWSNGTHGSLPDWNVRPMELLTVGDVGPYKRHDLVIRTLPILIDRHGLREIRYRIVGECPPHRKQAYEALAASLGVAERVRIEGRLDDDEVGSAYARAKCFVLMSVCESFGIPAIEAMTWGTPVVAANCCAMPEVCGDAAELAPIDDPPALADHIARVVKDPSLAESLLRRGAARAQQFLWSRTGQQIVTILESLLSVRPCSPRDS